MGKGARNREIRRLAVIAQPTDKKGRSVKSIARRMRKNFRRKFVRNGN